MVDIDGVLADYFKGFTEFVNRTLETDYDYTLFTKHSMRENMEDLSDYMYDSLKFIYRTGGEKCSLEVLEDGLSYLKSFRNKYKVLIWSTRPVHEYPVIKEFTLSWLKNKGIPYDDIVFTGSKTKKRVLEGWWNECKGREKQYYVLVAVEDSLEEANSISSLVDCVILLDRPYNQGKTNKGVIRKSVGSLT